MIKMSFEGKSYNFENIGEKQAYNIRTDIEMNEDASITDIMEAVVRLVRVAGYFGTKQNFLNAIEDIFENREE
jgi:hypothetical protein